METPSLDGWTPSEQRRSLFTFLGLSTLGGLIIVSVDAVQGASANFAVSVVVVAGLAACWALSFVRRWFVFTAVALPVLMLGLITANFLAGNGIHDSAASIYLVAILLATYFLGRRAAAWFTLLAVVLSSVTILLEVTHVYQTRFGANWGTYITYEVVLGLGGVLIWRMITRLERSAQALRVLNETLEARVDERTNDLLRTQEQLVRSESLAARGQLSAHLLHGLNTPLGALSSSGRSLHAVFAGVPDTLERFVAEGGDRELFARLAAGPAREGSWPRAVKTKVEQALGPLADRLEDLLEDPSDASAAWILERSATRQGALAVELAHELILARQLTGLVSTSTDRVTAVVASLRSFAENPGEEASSEFGLLESLERAVGVTRQTHHSEISITLDVPAACGLKGQAASLFRVWTHILDRLVGAAAPGARLQVHVSQEARPGYCEIAFRLSGDAPAKAADRGLWDFVTRVVSTNGGAVEDSGGSIVVHLPVAGT